MTVFFALTTGFFVLKWLGMKITNLALLKWISDGYELPSDKELKECTRWAVNRMLRIRE